MTDAASMGLFMILAWLLPDQKAIASLPGALFVGYIARLTYEHNRKDRTGR